MNLLQQRHHLGLHPITPGPQPGHSHRFQQSPTLSVARKSPRNRHPNKEIPKEQAPWELKD